MAGRGCQHTLNPPLPSLTSHPPTPAPYRPCNCLQSDPVTPAHRRGAVSRPSPQQVVMKTVTDEGQRGVDTFLVCRHRVITHIKSYPKPRALKHVRQYPWTWGKRRGSNFFSSNGKPKKLNTIEYKRLKTTVYDILTS